METAELDFPAIEAPPTIAPAPVVIATPLPAVPEVPSIKATVLAQFKDAEAGLLVLAEKYRAVAYDVATTKGMAEAVAARADLRDNGRLALTRAEKRVKSDVNDLKRVMSDEVDRLVAIVQPVEDAIDAQIKAEEARKAAAKAERERIETERIAGHRERMAKIGGYLTLCQQPGMTAARMEAGIAKLAAATFGADWQEFAVPAANLQCETLEAMRKLRDAAIEREAEQIRLDAQRAEQQRIAEQQAETQRLLDAQAAALAANTARVAGLQARIAEIHAAATGHERTPSWDLFEAIVAVEALEVGEAQYQELTPLAAAARAATLATLRSLHDAAVAREEASRVAVQEPIPAPVALLPAADAVISNPPFAAAAPVVEPIEPPAMEHPETTAALHCLEVEVDTLTEQQDRTRDALTQAIAMLDELICAHAPKRAAVALFARVSALRDLGGLPRVTPTTAT